MRKLLAGIVTAFAVVAATLAFGPALTATAAPKEKITYCQHVNGRGNTGHGFNLTTANADRLIREGVAQHARDIIPAFEGFPGVGDASRIANNCAPHAAPPAPPVEETPDPEPTDPVVDPEPVETPDPEPTDPVETDPADNGQPPAVEDDPETPVNDDSKDDEMPPAVSDSGKVTDRSGEIYELPPFVTDQREGLTTLTKVEKTSDELPATGAEDMFTLYAAVAFLAAGVGVLILGRRAFR